MHVCITFRLKHGETAKIGYRPRVREKKRYEIMDNITCIGIRVRRRRYSPGVKERQRSKIVKRDKRKNEKIQAKVERKLEIVR